MGKFKKVYLVTIGHFDKETDIPNWRSTKIEAYDALAASKAVNLGRGEYISEVRIIVTLDG